jgi:hypothetical protein
MITGLAAKEMVAIGAGARLVSGEILCVTFNVEDHVTGVVSNDGVRVHGAIVSKEMHNCFGVACIPLACCVVMDPIAVSMVESTAQA